MSKNLGYSLVFLLLIAFLGIISLQLHNMVTYPLERGYDATAHIDYIQYLRTHKTLPLPDEGWEMHQPPLYYWIASLLPTALNPHWLGFGMWLGLCGLIGWFLKTLVEKVPAKNRTAYWFLAGSIFLLSCATPVVVYLSAAISNEFFAAVVISAGLAYYTTRFVPGLSQSEKVGDKRNLILGLFLGAALLSKTTAVLLLAAIIIERSLATQRFKSVIIQLWKPFTIALLIGGWFYVRNVVLHGNPLFQAADYIPLSSYAQPIVERDMKFLFSPAAFLNQDLFVAHHSSLLVGTYNSWFYDGHGVMIPPQPFTKVGTMIVAMSALPLVVALVGVALKLQSYWQKKSWTRDQFLVLSIYTILLLVGYVYYNFRLPFYSTVKASFISSLLVPFTYFLFQGLIAIYQRLSRGQRWWALIGVVMFVTVLVWLIVRHFWVQAWWYA